MDTKKTKGLVNGWNASRGFGFIQVGRDRVFIHRKDVPELGEDEQLELGDMVEFVLVNLGRGPRAVRARIISRIGEKSEPTEAHHE